MHKQCFACCICATQLGSEYYFKSEMFFCKLHMNDEPPTVIAERGPLSEEEKKLKPAEQKEVGELSYDSIKIIRAMLKSSDKRVLMDIAKLALQVTNKLFDRS